MMNEMSEVAPAFYNPQIVPGWDSSVAEAFAVLKFEPWRVRVFPGSVLLGQGGTVLTWQENSIVASQYGILCILFSRSIARRGYTVMYYEDSRTS